MRLFYFTFLFAILIIAACSQDEACREKRDVNFKAGFFRFETTTAAAIDSLTVYGLGQDSLLYNNIKNLTKISLPLNNSDVQSIFVMKFNELYDTVFVLHTNTENFISYPCGTIITHKIDTVISTNHYIKGIKIQYHEINTTDVQHVQIFH